MGLRYLGWWRLVVIVTISFLAQSCRHAHDLSHNRRAVDSVVFAYILTDLKGDMMELNSAIASVDKIKLTRQDDIPIALVDLHYKDSGAAREFLYFDYATICRVRELIEQQKGITPTEIAERLAMDYKTAYYMHKIVLRTKRVR